MPSHQYKEWQDCPLDVATLAISSVTAAAKAAQLLTDSRGISLAISADISQIPFAFSSLENLKIENRTATPWGTLSGFFKTADGWIRLHGNYPHHATAITECFGVSNRENVSKLFTSLTKFEIEEAIFLNGGVASAVRDANEWSLHPQAVAMRDTPWIELELSPEQTNHLHTPKPFLPAEGIRVLDLTRVIAGPTCSQLLACLGADVLRVDPPSIPELQDQFISNAMGKRTTVIDFSTQVNKIHDLLPKAHIAIMGYSPKSLDKFGLSLDTLRQKYPHLLIACLSAWGDTGPWAARAGFDSIVQSATGIADACGIVGQNGEKTPGALPVQALDHSTGFILAAHILEALAHHQTGTIKTSLVGAAHQLLNMKKSEMCDADATLVTTRRNLSIFSSPYGKISVPSIPITVNGVHLMGKIQEYGSSQPSWC